MDNRKIPTEDIQVISVPYEDAIFIHLFIIN